MSLVHRLREPRGGQRHDAGGGIVIEPMRRRHIRDVLVIEHQVYPKPWTPGIFQSELDLVKAGQRYYVVAKDHFALVGYSGLLFVDSDAHVTNIAVDPEWQRRGIATELLLELCWKARERECQGLSLEGRVSNTSAQALYARFGFVPAGVRRKYYENVEDAIVMWCHDISSAEMAHRLRAIEEERTRIAQGSVK